MYMEFIKGEADELSKKGIDGEGKGDISSNRTVGEAQPLKNLVNYFPIRKKDGTKLNASELIKSRKIEVGNGSS